MEAIYWILSFLSDWAKLYMIVFLGLGFSRRSRKQFFVPLMSVAILVAIIFHLDRALLFVPITTALGAMVCTAFLLQRPKQLFVIPLAYIVVSYLEFLIASWVYWLGNESMYSIPDSRLLNIAVHSVMLLIVFVACTIMNVVRNRRLLRTHFFTGGLQESALIVLSIVGLFCILFYIAPAITSVSDNPGIHRQSQSIFMLTIGALFFFAVFLVAAGISERTRRLAAENQTYEELIKRQHEYYSEILKKQKVIDKLRHDIKEHMGQLQHYLDADNPQKAKEYIAEIYGVVEAAGSIVTGHPAVDALVNDIFDADFDLQWRGTFPANISITDFHLCTLLANILKNALEASRQCGNPFVQVEIRMKKDALLFIVANPVKEEVKMKNGFPYRKGGLGLQIIQEIVGVYHGSIRYICEKNNVTTEVLLNIIA